MQRKYQRTLAAIYASPTTDKGAITSIRKWLHEHGVEP